MPNETAFTMDTSSIKYGPGVTREVGYDMAKLGAKRVLVVTDARLATGESVATVLAALAGAGRRGGEGSRGGRGGLGDPEGERCGVLGPFDPIGLARAVLVLLVRHAHFCLNHLFPR